MSKNWQFSTGGVIIGRTVGHILRGSICTKIRIGLLSVLGFNFRLSQRTLTLLSEVSLYGWTPVWIVWIQLLCLCLINNIFTCSAKSKPVKQDISHIVILPLTKWVSVLWLVKLHSVMGFVRESGDPSSMAERSNNLLNQEPTLRRKFTVLNNAMLIWWALIGCKTLTVNQCAP